ncbi:NAD(P)H-dependent oxidoreductase subunit E [Azotosporobacter soli]|uniref:NAD(P)H-dependent oxidoreductase subunit E n=1 Tax=Azotosporobacter soli TaxID=3055040 RepID=UPI0031FF2A20
MEETMVRLAICFGSACHLKGSYAVLEAFQGLFEKYNLKRKIDLEGAFCNSHCTEGVVIKINDEVITHVSREKVYGIFCEKILGENACKS